MATSTGPCTASIPSTSSTAKPMACGSEVIPPGSSNSNATSKARRRGGANDPSVSASTGANSSDNPANDSDDSASTPRHVNTRPKHRSAFATPASHKTVLPIPASPASTNAIGPPPTSPTNASTAPSSSSRPTTTAIVTPQPFCTAPQAGQPVLNSAVVNRGRVLLASHAAGGSVPPTFARQSDPPTGALADESWESPSAPNAGGAQSGSILIRPWTRPCLIEFGR